MPKFSESSASKLATADLQLQQVFNRVILSYDCTVIEGHRAPERQLQLYHMGSSKVKFGKHNEIPSQAIDAGPYIAGRGIPWPTPGEKEYTKDLAHFYHFAGFVLGVAEELGVKLRWGGDWDRDNDLHDQTFDDLVHFELIE